MAQQHHYMLCTGIKKQGLEDMGISEPCSESTPTDYTMGVVMPRVVGELAGADRIRE